MFKISAVLLDSFSHAPLAFLVEILHPTVRVFVDERALIEPHLGDVMRTDLTMFQNGAPGGGEIAGKEHGA